MSRHRSTKQSGSSCISRASSSHRLLCTDNVAAMDTREKAITHQPPSAMTDILHHKDRHSPNQKRTTPRRHTRRPLEPRRKLSYYTKFKKATIPNPIQLETKTRRRESRATALPKNEHIQMWRSKACLFKRFFPISCEPSFRGLFPRLDFLPAGRPL